MPEILYEGEATVELELDERDFRDLKERGRTSYVLSNNREHFIYTSKKLKERVPEPSDPQGEVFEDIRGALYECLAAFADMEKRQQFDGEKPLSEVFQEIMEAYEIEKANRTFNYYDTINSNYK